MLDKMEELPLESIYWPDSTDITEDQVSNMAMSLMVHGLIEPIVVAPRDEKGYRGVIGRLRYMGMKERYKTNLKGKTILARIHKFESKMELKMWQMAENLHRRELPAMQRARQYQELYNLIQEKGGEEATLQILADTIEDMTGNKESTKTIQHYLTLTKLAPKAQEILTGEKLPLRSGLELARLKDSNKQVEIAEKVQEHPDQYPTVQAIKWSVDSELQKERSERRKKALQKKAEELRTQGKIVVLDSAYSGLSYEEQRKYKRFWDEPFDKCKEGCPNFGIELGGNFQQHPMCADPECYKKLKHKDAERASREDEAKNEILQKEQQQIYTMDPDDRHWHLALIGLIEPWDLRSLLGIDRETYDVGGMAPALWKKVQSLSQKECQQVLIRKAVEKILTRPHAYGYLGPAKEWAVKEFGLTAEVFLGEEQAE